MFNTYENVYNYIINQEDDTNRMISKPFSYYMIGQKLDKLE